MQNEVGNRKTASLVGYSGHQRFIGDAASSQASSNYKNTIKYIKRFMGAKSGSDEMKKESSKVDFAIVDDNGRTAFKVKYDGKDEVLKPEQVAAALLYKCRQVAEAGLDSKVSDVVIGVPHYWSDEERRALLDAASLANLNVLRLMNETTAIALAYGLLRPLPKDETKNVCFVDVGEASTCVAVVSFVQGKLKVLGTAAERHLGGRDFDQIIVDHLVADIKERYKMDVTTQPKAMMKLRKECERVKRVLSANNKVQWAVEYIMNDKDVGGFLDRETFEAVAKKNITARFVGVCQQALTASNLKAEDLFAVEVVGGAVRIPILQAELSAFFGKELSKTCDGDESVARGCALQCAMLSPSVKVREFEVQDSTPYAIEVAWGPVPAAGQPLQEESSSILFTEGNAVPSQKMISFKERTEPFQLVARYADVSKLAPGTNPVIAKFVVSGMPSDVPAGALGPPKIKVKVQLNIHGVIDISTAQLLTNFEEDEPAPAPEAKDTEMKDAAADAPAAESDAAATDAAPPADGEAKPEDAKEAEKMDTTPIEPKKKKVCKRESLKVESQLLGLPKPVLQSCLEREVAMAHADKVIADTNAARNSLESYVLEQRVRMVEQLKDFVEQGVSDTFCDTCRTTEDWLYEDGEDAEKSEYNKRLAELKKTGDAVEKRLWESENRPQYINGLRKEISNWESLALSNDEKYAHITEEERQKVKDACSAANSWLSAELAKLEASAKHVDPCITCKQMEAKARELSGVCAPVMNKKKPPPPKEEKKEEKAEETPAEPAAEPAAADAADAAPTDAETAEAKPAAEAEMDTKE